MLFRSKEPYRLEGKKTMGLELAEQLGWTTPDVLLYPTGGGTGLVGIAKAYEELAAMGWLSGTLPRFVSVQAEGCAPIVRAWAEGAETAAPWENPVTHAAGLRVPAPLGDRLVLRALRESGGDAESASEDEIREYTSRLSHSTGIDAAPEGGAALCATAKLVRQGRPSAESEVVVYNTGSGASYRQ